MRDRARLHGPGRQCATRTVERRVRIRALACLRWAGWHGWSLSQCAEAFDLSVETLRDWQARWQDPLDRLAPRPRGAPALTVTPAERRAVLDFLALFGATLPISSLQEHFPRLARRDLGCLRFLASQDQHALESGAFYRSVTWQHAGAVWAMDHTEPPTPIDGIYRFVLTVRDLASGATLASHAVEHADAPSTIALLEDLCARHGAPLALKADNGSAFIAQDTREYLERIGVILLLSPPYYPRYNGACEAGNGTVKRLAHDLAVRHDRPHQWTLDDLEGARLLANRRITDRRQMLTPEQRFDARTPITNDRREQLATAVQNARQRRVDQDNIAPERDDRKITADALNRHAITDALAGLGYITIRCRQVRLCNPLREVG